MATAPHPNHTAVAPHAVPHIGRRRTPPPLEAAAVQFTAA
uniref:Uncharacterized protein n=1 Tax=Arundo donax TaxID=35708 RepID=A0A0A9FAH6_ARUDO